MTLTLGLLALVACTSDTEPVDTDRAPIFPIGDSGEGPPEEDGLFEPVAVGFEYQGGLGPLGQWLEFRLNENSDPTPPLLTLTFASEVFFSAADELTQDLNSCSLVATLTPLPTQLQIKNRSRGDGSQAILWQTYDFAFPSDPYQWGSSCGDPIIDGDGYLDPKVWGVDGQDLIDKFLGAHVAIGFGPFTDYLIDSVSDYDELEEDERESFFTMYIAINDKSGAFIAEDWTRARTFFWDPDSGVPEVDSENFLTPIPADTEGGWLNSAYIQSRAYWYQDFPLLNLDNLKDGAPVE
ncbi:MAG: hypothetical protein AAGA48_18485 [Myxococcota bacterium]